MNKKQIIIDCFHDAPETWTAPELQTLSDIAGENITRAELRTARRVAESITARHICAAIAETREKIRAACFSERVTLLTRELLPALEFLEQQNTRAAAPVVELSKSARTPGDVDGSAGEEKK